MQYIISLYDNHTEKTYYLRDVSHSPDSSDFSPDDLSARVFASKEEAVVYGKLHFNEGNDVEFINIDIVAL